MTPGAHPALVRSLREGTDRQSAILPFVPYLDTLRWVSIAVALGGIAVTIHARLDDWRSGRR